MPVDPKELQEALAVTQEWIEWGCKNHTSLGRGTAVYSCSVLAQALREAEAETNRVSDAYKLANHDFCLAMKRAEKAEAEVSALKAKLEECEKEKARKDEELKWRRGVAEAIPGNPPPPPPIRPSND